MKCKEINKPQNITKNKSILKRLIHTLLILILMNVSIPSYALNMISCSGTLVYLAEGISTWEFECSEYYIPTGGGAQYFDGENIFPYTGQGNNNSGSPSIKGNPPPVTCSSPSAAKERAVRAEYLQAKQDYEDSEWFPNMLEWIHLNSLFETTWSDGSFGDYIIEDNNAGTVDVDELTCID